MTELRETATNIRTVTFWPLVTAVRRKSGERRTPVGGRDVCMPLFKFKCFSIMK